MTRDQIDIFDMSLSVENLMNDNVPIWTSNAPISAAKTVLSDKITAIAKQMNIQIANTTGITVDKDGLRTKLEAQAFTISAAISGYASTISNQTLYVRIHYTKTDLMRYRDAELIGICTNLYTDTNTHIANLAPYGITAANLSTFQTAIAAFAQAMKNPTEAIAKRKGATEQLAILIPQLTEWLRTTMDNLIIALTATSPDFVKTYQNVRLIDNSPSFHFSLTTSCLDAATQSPIAGVKLAIPSLSISRTSGATGYNTYRGIPEGTHQMEVSQPNYISQTVTFTVVAGQTTELAILLVHI